LKKRILSSPGRGKGKIERDADVMDMVCEQGRLGKRGMAEENLTPGPFLTREGEGRRGCLGDMGEVTSPMSPRHPMMKVVGDGDAGRVAAMPA